MRTTLNVDDDALDLARRFATRRKISLGEALSELVRRGSDPALVTMTRHGLATVVLKPDSPKVTSAHVERLLDELP